MCRVNVTIDQAVHTVGPVFELIDTSAFFIRSIRVAPVASSRRADVYLSLGGGSKNEMARLLQQLRKLPAVQSTQCVTTPGWLSEGPQARTPTFEEPRRVEARVTCS